MWLNRVGAMDLYPRTHLRSAAWVPDDEFFRPWEGAAQLAAEWIWSRCAVERVAPILVTNTDRRGGWGMRVLDEIVRAGGHATPQTECRFKNAPVFAYLPHPRSLRFAMDLARGYSLVAVEGSVFPLSGWAAGADAISLPIKSVSSHSIPDQVRRDLDTVILYGGHNDWAGTDEKRYARSSLIAHVRAGMLDPCQAASYAISQGVSALGAKRLRELLRSENRGPSEI